MELKGEYRIAAPREKVWAMLNDPLVLRDCIPGCESLEGSAADGFSARVTTKVGPVKATFNGAVTLTNVRPPESYTISGEGKGGVAGFAKGGADVRLTADSAGTVLAYAVNAQVGGKLAQLGARLIDSTAKKLSDQFFSCLAAKAGASVTAAATASATAAPFAAAGAATAPAAGAAGIVHDVEEVAQEVEEEVEAKAAVGFLGGPIVWGLLVILALLLVYGVAMRGG
jgi:carbon monoxide dehydrogenase subunit G